MGDVDGGLGGAVQVVQFDLRPERQEAVDGGGGQRLAGAEHPSHGGEPAAQGRVGLGGGGERGEHGRHEVAGGDGGAGGQVGQLGGVAVAAGAGQHDAGADGQREEELPDRDVEPGRGLLQDAVGGADRVQLPHPLQAVDDGPVGDDHALGAAGGAGGEDDVGGVVGAGLGEDGVLRAGGVDRQDGDAVHRRDGVGGTGQGEHADRAGVLDHAREAFGRVLGVQRQVGGAGPLHAQQGDHQVGGARHGDADHGVRSGAVGGQRARQRACAIPQLTVGQLFALEVDGDRVGRGGDLFGDPGDQGARADRDGGGVPLPRQAAQFLGGGGFDPADRLPGVGQGLVQDAQQAGAEQAGGGPVEQVLGVDDGQVGAGAVGGLHEGERQVEAGGVHRVGQQGGAGAEQAVQAAGLLAVLHHHLEQRWRPRLRSGLTSSTRRSKGSSWWASAPSTVPWRAPPAR